MYRHQQQCNHSYKLYGCTLVEPTRRVSANGPTLHQEGDSLTRLTRPAVSRCSSKHQQHWNHSYIPYSCTMVRRALRVSARGPAHHHDHNVCSLACRREEKHSQQPAWIWIQQECDAITCMHNCTPGSCEHCGDMHSEASVYKCLPCSRALRFNGTKGTRPCFFWCLSQKERNKQMMGYIQRSGSGPGSPGRRPPTWI